MHQETHIATLENEMVEITISRTSDGKYTIRFYDDSSMPPFRTAEPMSKEEIIEIYGDDFSFQSVKW